MKDRPEGNKSGSPKHFVLDTNVLLHNPDALFMFADNEVVIPFAVLEELDKFKKENNDVGRNARQVIRHLDALRVRGSLGDGVQWNGNGGRIRIVLADEDRPGMLREDTPDNRIVSVAWAHQKDGKRTVFVSKDINVRIKADALGMHAEDFEAQKVDADQLYRGYIVADVPGTLIDQLYQDKHLAVEALLEHLRAAAAAAETASTGSGQGAELSGSDGGNDTAGGGAVATATSAGPGAAPATPMDQLFANEYVLMRNALDPSHTGLARVLGETSQLIPVHGPRKPVYGIMARNMQQTMAFDLLLNDDVKLLTLLGTAGTGKTLLAIAAGMSRVFKDQRFDKLLVARPIMPMGRDIGYLPGDKDEKLSAWMQPIFDNLTYLLSTRGAEVQHAESKPTEARIKQMIDSGQLVLEPLTYIRGRSIPHQFIIIDEAQNLTPHEVKTIVSRVGEGTKIVLTGDIAQIDNPYLDASSNGLSYIVEKLKGEPIVGTVMLEKSERSELASLAASRM